MLNKIFLQKIADFIDVNRLLDKDGHYLLALSGGADSVALLRVLHILGYSFEAIHCNFHLRGEESGRDEQFCRKLTDEMGIKLHLVHFDTRFYASFHHVSIEMAARELRYRYFEDVRKNGSFTGICVAHHRDDSVETLLLNLIRGTGVHGLAGIAPRNGYVLRPLLCVSRDEIERFLHELHQPYVDDSTNFVDDVARNKIRLHVLPHLKEINPAVCKNIAKTALRMAEAAKIVDETVEKRISEVLHATEGRTVVNRSSIKDEYTLYYILDKFGFSSHQIEQIFSNMNAETGKTFQSKTHELLFNRGQLIIQPARKIVRKKMIVPIEGTYVFSEKVKFHFSTEVVTNSFEVSRVSSCVCLDASRVAFPLTIRYVEERDRFVPFGMKGSKLVSDFMTDRKMSLFDKREQLVVVDATDNILWLVNLRPDNRFAITSDTVSVLRISYL